MAAAHCSEHSMRIYYAHHFTLRTTWPNMHEMF